MTTQRRDGMETPFSAWVRSHPALDSKEHCISITDSDMWCHRFSLRAERQKVVATDIRDAVDHIMLVEIKTFSANVRYAQRDTLSVIDALLRLACSRHDKLGRLTRRPVRITDGRISNRPTRIVRCFGVHLLELSSDRPDTSNEILWDKRTGITEQSLVELIRFERDPDAPHRLLDTRRHHLLAGAHAQPQLQLVDGGRHDDFRPGADHPAGAGSEAIGGDAGC